MPASPYNFAAFVDQHTGESLPQLVAAVSAELAAVEQHVKLKRGQAAPDPTAYVTELAALLHYLEQVAVWRSGVRLRRPNGSKAFYSYRRLLQLLVDRGELPSDVLGPFGSVQG